MEDAYVTFPLYQHLMDATEEEPVYFIHHDQTLASIPWADIMNGTHRLPVAVVDYEDLCDANSPFASGLAVGWTQENSRTWFGEDGVDEEEGTEGLTLKTTVAQAKHLDDNMAINESIHRIMFMGAKTTSRGVLLSRSYSIECDFRKLLQKDHTDRYTHLQKNNPFIASSSMITQLPFQFVLELEENKWVEVPAEFKKQMHEAVASYRAFQVRQLISHFSPWKEHMIFKTRVFLGGRSGYSTRYTNDPFLTECFADESGVLHRISGLNGVGSGSSVICGYGASKKDGGGKRGPVTTSHQLHLKNMWYDSVNHGHNCLFGAIVNLFYHMGAKDEAIIMKSVPDMTSIDEIQDKLGITHCPKKVRASGMVHVRDVAFWILRSKFKCEVLTLKESAFSSPEMCIQSLATINMPVLGVARCNSLGTTASHVMCFWNGWIIDLEEPLTCDISLANITRLCNAEVACFKEAYVIVPPHHLRANFRNVDGGGYNWGTYSHLQKINVRGGKGKRRRMKRKWATAQKKNSGSLSDDFFPSSSMSDDAGDGDEDNGMHGSTDGDKGNGMHGSTQAEGDKGNGMHGSTQAEEPDHPYNQAFLDLLVEKLTVFESCNDEEDVKEQILQLEMEREIPQDLIPQPKNSLPLFMMPQGLYPPWINDIAPYVLKQVKTNAVATKADKERNRAKSK